MKGRTLPAATAIQVKVRSMSHGTVVRPRSKTTNGRSLSSSTPYCMGKFDWMGGSTTIQVYHCPPRGWLRYQRLIGTPNVHVGTYSPGNVFSSSLRSHCTRHTCGGFIGKHRPVYFWLRTLTKRNSIILPVVIMHSLGILFICIIDS